MAASSIFFSANVTAARVPSWDSDPLASRTLRLQSCVRGEVPAQCSDREGVWLPLCPSATGLEITLVWAGQDIQFVSRESKRGQINSRLENHWNGHCETTLTNGI